MRVVSFSKILKSVKVNEKQLNLTKEQTLNYSYTMTQANNLKWDDFIKELSNIIFFWFFAILFFFTYRLIFIFIYSNEIDWNNFSNNISQTLITGFRFDTMVTSYFIIIPLLATLITAPLNKIKIARFVRLFFQQLFIVLSALICIVTINYYSEYHNQFNHFLFLGLYDDLDAVFKTIIVHFHPYLNLFVFLTALYLSRKIIHTYEEKRFIYHILKKIKIPKIILLSLVLVLFILSIRGSIEIRPIMRKWSYVTNDEFLNKTIINPFKSLLYAIEDFKELNVNLPNGENPFGKVSELWEKETICENIEKASKGALISQPKQLFLIVMESYDSWPLEDKYRSFGMSKNLSEIANNGIYFNNFLPSSESTMNSIASIITGIPYSGISQSQIGAINPRYCSSIFDQFKKLGYQTNFFYGGLLSWGNISNLFENQGVENQYSAVDMGGKTESGIWGIEDEKLFELVIKTIHNQNSSFNIILTTSYHPPYSINLKEKGFPYGNISEIPDEMLKHYDGSMSLKELGHLWYSDKCIGDFIKNAQQKFPNAIFCFTGDHYGRRFINSKPNLKEKSLVPFIIYGSSIKDSIYNTPGSHIDIFPTLVEMIAPKGFNYYSFGESLFNTKNIGIGKARSITKKTLEYYPKSSTITSFNLFNNKTSKLDSSSGFIKYKKLNSLAWHYTIKGDSIYPR